MKFWKGIVLCIVLSALATAAYAGSDITKVVRNLAPNPVAPNTNATVSLQMQGNSCQVPGNPGASISLVMDRSGSMSRDNPTRMSSAVAAAKRLVTRVDAEPLAGMGLVSFNQNVSTDAALNSSASVLNSALDSLTPGGDTAIGDGINAAASMLSGAPAANVKAMIVLSDGINNDGVNPSTAAASACSAGISVYAIGVAASPSSIDPALPTIPCNGGTYNFVAAPVDQAVLDSIFDQIADTVLGPLGTNISITEVVPPGLSVSNISDGGVLSGNTITWSLPNAQNNKSVSYQVSGANPGDYPFTAGNVSYDNCANTQADTAIDNGTLIITVAPPTDIPEPITIALFGSGVAAAGAYARRKRNQSQEN